MVARPALVIYSFVPKALPNYPDVCREAHDYLKIVWRGCDTLGMNKAVPGLNTPTEFPETINLNDPLFRVVAAKADLERRAKKEHYQAFLFGYQDVLGLVATLETDVSSQYISEWKVLLEQWTGTTAAAYPPNGIMEETYLFTVLDENNNLATNLNNAVTKAMPGDNGAPWRAMSPYITTEGYCIWGGEQINGRRVAALVAPQDTKDDFFNWTVWRGLHELAPFARYSMHGAKLHFARKLFEMETPMLHEKSRRLDEALSAIVLLHQQSQESGLWNPHEIAKAHSVLTAEEIKNFDLLYGMSKLRELNLTTRIAARNMRQLVPPADSGTASNGNHIFQQDRARSTWLQEQIEMDLGYLTALRDRVLEGHRMGKLLLERESEKTSKRLKNLVLLQGTVIGSLTIGLLMLPAFEAFHADMLVWAVTALLMALVLTLPTLFERWHEPYTALDRLAGGVLGAAALFLGTTLWEFVGEKVPWWPVAKVSLSFYVVFNIGVCVVGFLSGYFGVERLEKLKRKKAYPTP
jgi:CASPASE and TPR Repeat-associated protein